MIGAVFALALLAADASPSSAAPAPAPPTTRSTGDLIADILAQTPPAPVTPKGPPAPTAAPGPGQPAPPTPPITPPIALQIDPAAASTLDTAPGGEPPTRYDQGMRSSFQAREARQGDLDGRWTLTDPDGKALYVFQLADPGRGRGPVEGAWRDLGQAGGPAASGFIDAADRVGRALTLNFQDAGPCTVTLTQAPDGRWTGQIKTAAATRPVVMARS
ncbi:MAG TPA: hypothetical protein VMU59_02215 [Caulobacteraceae bacterium]|nr:hypothetical protein [Caulobacteraceae bacterium]